MFTGCTILGNRYIRLQISAADREDAWDMCRVAVHYGGTEVSDGCFVFADEERWLTAQEVLRFRFGPEYFEAIAPADTCHGRGKPTLSE